MASFQKTLNVDILSVRTILAKGDTNTTLPALSVLTTDGLGGTMWVNIDTLKNGGVVNQFITTPSTFISGLTNTAITIINGPNVGLSIYPTAPSAVQLYSKAFGEINVNGQDSIYSFNESKNTLQNTLEFVPSGLINLYTNSSTNQLTINASNYTFSTISTVLQNINKLNSNIQSNICTFNSPFSTFIYNAISSFSTTMGPTPTVLQLYSSISSFSTAMGTTPNVLQLYSSISSFSTAMGTTPNVLQLYSSISSFSSALGNVPSVLQLYSSISSFSSAMGTTPNVLQMYSSISSFSAAMGTTPNVLQMYSSISSFSAAMGTTPNVLQMYSSISSFSAAMGTTPNVIQMYSSISSFSAAMGTTPNVLQMYSSISSFSAAMGTTPNVLQMYSSISSFSAAMGPIPNMTDVYSAISSFSIAMGDTPNVLQMYSSISSFSAAMGDTPNVIQMYSSISSFSAAMGDLDHVSTIFASSLTTSEIYIKSNKQPFIQYGSSIINSSGFANITLPIAYSDTSYGIQLTYINYLAANLSSLPICTIEINTNTFSINGSPSKLFYWTTYGII